MLLDWWNWLSGFNWEFGKQKSICQKIIKCMVKSYWGTKSIDKCKKKVSRNIKSACKWFGALKVGAIYMRRHCLYVVYRTLAKLLDEVFVTFGSSGKGKKLQYWIFSTQIRNWRKIITLMGVGKETFFKTQINNKVESMCKCWGLNP